MAYRYNDNTERIIQERRQRIALAIRFALADIHRKSTPVTPKLSGQLRTNIRKSVRGLRGRIHWGAKYAEYQERGYTSGKVRRYTTPGTSAHFAERSVKDTAKQLHTYVRKVGL